jgi:hypothetical protein
MAAEIFSKATRFLFFTDLLIVVLPVLIPLKAWVRVVIARSVGRRSALEAHVTPQPKRHLNFEMSGLLINITCL